MSAGFFVLKLAASLTMTLALIRISSAQVQSETDPVVTNNHAAAATLSSFTVLVDFNLFNGDIPTNMAPVQGTDGGLYGTTFYGGLRAEGNVFRIGPKGGLSNLYSFCAGGGTCSDGATTYAGVIQGMDGNFYGTTNVGGTSDACAGGCGTVFQLTPQGVLITLHDFDGTDGNDVRGTLLQATDGNFYGTSIHGGAQNGGAVFRITPEGTFSTLYSFCSLTNCTDGDGPLGGLVQASDGNLYGTTLTGGEPGGGYGTVFKLTLTGILTTIHVFNFSDGAQPYAPLTQASDGKLYGTTSDGGTFHQGSIFSITPTGTFRNLYNFCSQSGAFCTDGNQVFSGVIQGTDGNFYGTTFTGGTNDYGTIFRLTPQGRLTTLYSFDNTTGANPYGTLAQATNGLFYGTASYGGTSTSCYAGCGTLFRFSQGLGQFVTTQTSIGKVGSPAVILGTDFTGSTQVTFNGAPASFTIVSPSEIIATVPTGATSGSIYVTTPSGTLKSNRLFYIRR